MIRFSLSERAARKMRPPRHEPKPYCPRESIRESERQLRLAARARDVARLTEEQIEARIIAAMIEAALKRGVIVLDDVTRADVPQSALTASRFRRCLALAKEQCPKMAHIFREGV